MDRTDLAFAGAASQAQLIRAGEVSSLELTELYLQRIDQLDSQLNAFVDVFADRARAEAREADARRAAGQGGALNGVPVAIKDVEDVAQTITGFGTAAFSRPANGDGELVRRLRRAGAVIVGKTALPELAIWGFTDGPAHGPTRNPWNPGRIPGGSSGGSGAAIAAGLVGLATASDGGGSIRIPAAACGVFGLKPQRGRLPLRPADHWYGLSVHGCLTRSVADSALFLEVAADADGGEASFTQAAAERPERLRIACSSRVPPGAIGARVDPEVRRALDETAQVMQGFGHRVHAEDPPYGGAATRLTRRYLRGIHDDVRAVPHPERLEARTRGIGRIGGLVPAALARRAQALAEADRRRIAAIYERCDVLLTPTVCVPPAEVDHWRDRGALSTLIEMTRMYAFTPMWNHTGQPVAAVPAGFTADGLPLSVSLVGRPGDERTLLSLAAELEAERPWADRRPPIS